MVRGKDTAFQNVSSMMDYPSKNDGSYLRDVPGLDAHLKQFFKPTPPPHVRHLAQSHFGAPSHPRPAHQPHPAGPQSTCRHAGLYPGAGLRRVTHQSSALWLGVSGSCRQWGAGDTSGWTQLSLQPRQVPSHHCKEEPGQEESAQAMAPGILGHICAHWSIHTLTLWKISVFVTGTSWSKSSREGVTTSPSAATLLQWSTIWTPSHPGFNQFFH